MPRLTISASLSTAMPVPLFRADPLAALSWLRHGFTTRAGGVSSVYGRAGDLNLGLTQQDDPAAVQANRDLALRAVAGDTASLPWTLANTRQIHSDTILLLTADAPRPPSPGDALVTAVPGLLLAVLAADCVPILLADVRHRVVAAVHAGWRGTVSSIVESTVRTMQTHFGSCPEDVLAAIGPSIGPCCYGVGDEVRSRFHDAFAYAPELFRDGRLNLWEANRRQLLTAGLAERNITVLGQCAACTRDADGPRFFSHRAQHGVTGRMMGLIGIVPEPR